MAKVVKPIVVIVAIVAVVLSLQHIRQKRLMVSKVGPVDTRYEEEKTEAEFTELKQDYEKLLGEVSGKNKGYIEGQVASCEAWLAFLRTSAKPSIRKYEDCIKKMERAQELTGDKQGVWAKKLAEFRPRHKESLGPELATMQSEYGRLSKLPFIKAVSDLETLYRWRKIWHDQDLHVNDAGRNAVFAQTREILLKNYCLRFEQSIQKARKAKGKSEAALSAKSAPLGAVAQVQRFDEAKAAAYRSKYAKDLAEAQKAAKELEALMEKMMGAM